MSPKLIHLHIPKTGGTSQRFILTDLYGKSDVFWYGIDDEAQQVFQPDQAQAFRVLGGHKPLSYFPPELDALYTAVVREPVSRVVSLYSYYAKPEFALDHSRRDDHFHIWQDRGMDANSIVNSLKQCSQFRREVENYQCRFLSRGEANFTDTRATLEQSSVMICNAQNTTALNHQLGQLLDWHFVPQQSLNRSRRDSETVILSEPGAREAIEQLVVEDRKLYEFVTNLKDGVWTNLPDPEKHRAALRIKTPVNPGLFWNQVNIYSKGYVGVDAQGRGSTGIIINNDTNTQLNRDTIANLGLAYDIIDDKGNNLTPQPQLLEFDESVPARGKLSFNLQVAIPEAIRQQASRISVGFTLGPHEGVQTFNPLHQAFAIIINSND